MITSECGASVGSKLRILERSLHEGAWGRKDGGVSC